MAVVARITHTIHMVEAEEVVTTKTLMEEDSPAQATIVAITTQITTTVAVVAMVEITTTIITTIIIIIKILTKTKVTAPLVSFLTTREGSLALEVEEENLCPPRREELLLTHKSKAMLTVAIDPRREASTRDDPSFSTW